MITFANANISYKCLVVEDEKLSWFFLWFLSAWSTQLHGV